MKLRPSRARGLTTASTRWRRSPENQRSSNWLRSARSSSATRELGLSAATSSRASGASAEARWP